MFKSLMELSILSTSGDMYQKAGKTSQIRYPWPHPQKQESKKGVAYFANIPEHDNQKCCLCV